MPGARRWAKSEEREAVLCLAYACRETRRSASEVLHRGECLVRGTRQSGGGRGWALRDDETVIVALKSAARATGRSELAVIRRLGAMLSRATSQRMVDQTLYDKG